jgi:dTDP-4-dehydrorhamnose reductase
LTIEHKHRVLLVGKYGQLGFELNRILAPLADLAAVDVEEFDLTDATIVRSMVRELRPNLIVNAAAYTDVEKAEEEPELANAINGIAPGILAEEANSVGAGLVHYSTDYVFDGSKASAYVEDDKPAPLSAYGRSKLAGENAIRAVGVPHLILRTSWLYGTRGRNFLLTILRLARSKDELRMLVELDWDLPTMGETYHVTAQGSTSWFGFAKAIISQALMARSNHVRLVPISTNEYPTKAHRPLNSVLSNEKLLRDFGISLPKWEEDLKTVISLLDAESIALMTQGIRR